MKSFHYFYTSLVFLHKIFYFPLSLCISHFHRHLPWGQFGDFRVCRSATSWISTALGAEEKRYMIPKFLVRSSGCWVLVHQLVQVQYSTVLMYWGRQFWIWTAQDKNHFFHNSQIFGQYSVDVLRLAINPGGGIAPESLTPQQCQLHTVCYYVGSSNLELYCNTAH